MKKLWISLLLLTFNAHAATVSVFSKDIGAPVLMDQVGSSYSPIINAVVGPITVAPTVHYKEAILRNVYSSTNVTTSAYVAISSAMVDAVTQLEVFDSSGQTLVLATGTPGSEVDQFNIFPGGNGVINRNYPAGTIFSVKAVTATASVGELDINVSQ